MSRDSRNHVFALGVVWITCAVGCNKHDDASDTKSSSAASELGSSQPKAESKPVSDPPAASTSQERCRKFCGHTESMHCGPPSKCAEGCERMLDANVCRAQVLKFFDCAEREPVDHWECDHGAPSIKDGFCEAPQAAFVECLQTSGTH